VWWLNIDLGLVPAMYDLPWDLIGFWKLVPSYPQSIVGFLSVSLFRLVLTFCDWFGVWMDACNWNVPQLPCFFLYFYFIEKEVCAWKSLLVCLIIYINLCGRCLVWAKK